MLIFSLIKLKQEIGFDQQVADLRAEHKKEIDHAREVWEQKKQATKKLEIEREGIKHKRLF